MMNDDKPEADSSDDEVQDLDLAAEPETVLVASPKAKRGAGFGALLFMSLLAAGGGAVGGAALTHHGLIFPKNISTQQNPNGALQQDIAQLKSQFSALKEEPPAKTQDNEDMRDVQKRLTALESRPQATEDGTVIAPAASPDFAAFEARIEALETALTTPAGADISDFETRLEKLETITAQVKPDEPSEIDTRLSALEDIAKAEPIDLAPYETRIAALEAIPAQVAVDVSGLKKRLTRLETALGNVRAALPLPEFPSAKVLEALSGDSDSEKGWIGRTLGKHVKVADEASAQQVTNIENLLAAGDIDTALSQANDLPENGRAAAQDWIDAVSAQRKLP